MSKVLQELKDKYENEQSQYIDIDGTHIHFRDEGNADKPVLLMIHGVLSSLHTWDGWVEALGSHYRLIRMDIPGFGLTGPARNRDYSPEYAADFCEKFTQALGIDDGFYLAGNSLGGFLSWNYAAKYPERVGKLVLLDPIGYPQPVPALIKLIVSPLLKGVAKLTAPRVLVDRGVREVYGNPRKIKRATFDLYNDMLKRPGNRECMVETLEAMTFYSDHPTLKNKIRDIKAPTLMLWGRKDRWVPIELLENWLMDLHTKVEHVIYEGVGHIPMEEIPEISARDAHSFLQS